MNTESFCPNGRLLNDIDSDFTISDKVAAKDELSLIQSEVAREQIVFHADGRRSLLIILQGMDTSGKDGTIKKVFLNTSPMGLKIANFKKPNKIEMAHDYLWRVHQETPERGQIGIFNRSHYEDVLVTRVEDLISQDHFERRLEHINNFEKMLHDEGTEIIKFYLHISPKVQKERIIERLQNSEKHWKFDPDDINSRKKWTSYIKTYDHVISKTDTEYAPWYVIPADHKWSRNLIVAKIVLSKLKSLDSKFPKADFEPSIIKVPDIK